LISSYSSYFLIADAREKSFALHQQRTGNFSFRYLSVDLMRRKNRLLCISRAPEIFHSDISVRI